MHVRFGLSNLHLLIVNDLLLDKRVSQLKVVLSCHISDHALFLSRFVGIVGLSHLAQMGCLSLFLCE
jgi:hypothetical protein